MVEVFCIKHNCDKYIKIRQFTNKDTGKQYECTIYICKECDAEYWKQYREDNKDDIVEYKKEYYIEHKEELSLINKEWRETNKEIISEKQKEYYIEHKEELSIYNKKWRAENKEKIKIDKQIYAENNKDKIKEYSKEWQRARREDPAFRIKVNISKQIARALKDNKSSKNGKSCWGFLGYKQEILRDHCEIQFSNSDNLSPGGAIWMTWENYGKYNRKTWDDDDPTTWTWQLDHIIPHSTFKYTSMEDQSFKDCWALSNLRPLSSKQNQKDGATKSRHKKKEK